MEFFKNKIDYLKKNKEKYLVFSYPILSGILFSSGYNYSSVWFLGLFSLIPLIRFFYKIKKAKNILFGTLIFALIYYGSVSSWLLEIDVFVWSGISNPWLLKVVLYAYWMFFFISICVIPFLFLSWLFFKFKTGKYFDIFLLASLWVLMEYLRTFLYSIIYYGDQSLFGPNNTLGFLGYLLGSNYNLLQFAKFGGVYVLSFMVVLINLSLYWIIFKVDKNKKKFKIIFIAVFVIFLFFPLNKFLKEKNENQKIKISVLQTKNEAFFQTNDFLEREKRKKYDKLLREIKKDNFDPEIIVFPEDTRFTKALIDNKMIRYYYGNFFGGKEKMVIDSGRIGNEENDVKLRLYYYNTKTALTDKYDKMSLTPGGEYMPDLFLFISKLVGFGDWAEKTKNSKYTKGEEISIGHFKNEGIGGVFCFEIFSPEITRKMTQKGAGLFVNPSSHSSFRGDKVLYNQAVNMTKVRAVENNRYFIQAGNYIPSSIITNRGEILSGENEDQSILNGEINFKKNKTLYVQWGNWFVGVAFLILIFCFRLKLKTKT